MLIFVCLFGDLILDFYYSNLTKKPSEVLTLNNYHSSVTSKPINQGC